MVFIEKDIKFKYISADLPSVNGNCQPPSFNDPLVGTWKLAQIPGAMGVGPNQGDVSWWSSSLGDVTSRACLFDDSIHFFFILLTIFENHEVTAF